MSHVDEGTIHAWLDGAFAPDDPARTRIEQHLADCEACRAAVETERRVMERAADVLGQVAPDAVRVEPFERILAARRARDAQHAGQPARTGHGFRIPMALAATLVLAIGATWFARQLMPVTGDTSTETEFMDAATSEQDEAAATAGPSLPSPPDPEAVGRQANQAELGTPPVAGPPPGRDERVASDDIRLAPVVVTGAQVGTTAVAPQAVAPPSAQAAARRNRTPAETRRIADSVLRLDEVVVTGVAALASREIADADAVIAVHWLNEAADDVVWTPADPDTVAARLGISPLGLTGLSADSVQIGNVGGAVVARSVYTVDGQPVELLQWATGRMVAGLEWRALERSAAVAAGAALMPGAAKSTAPTSPAAYRLGGIDFVLRGPLPADSLAALAQRAAAGS
ncbi:MAG TPA: zf-HC2 domain-containing protein [Longimicrobiales bacterium]|nr:zf-HC2 domain-containing protein [Longimicrobiales bacterium]